MASEDAVGKTSDSAVSVIVNLADETKLAIEGVMKPRSTLLSISKSLAEGGIAGVVGPFAGIIAMSATNPLDMLRGHVSFQINSYPVEETFAYPHDTIR